MNGEPLPLEIQAARPRDAAEIVALIRAGFSPETVDLTIYGAAGVDRYIAEQIAVQETGGEAHYTVARGPQGLIGAVELRRLPTALFLNYIAITPECRGQGLGNRLFRAAVKLADDSTRTDARRENILLDVLEDNHRARRWYGGLEFRSLGATSWWTLPLPRGTAAPVSVSGYAQAQACQREFGFSRFTLVAGDRHVDVGRLGDRWFRVTKPELLELPGVAETLRRIDDSRGLLVLAPDTFLPPAAAARPVARTFRLIHNLAVLSSRWAEADVPAAGKAHGSRVEKQVLSGQESRR